MLWATILGERGSSREKKKKTYLAKRDNFCKAVRTPTGEVGEEADSRKYRNISLDRWIFLYRSNFSFLPDFFLTPRMTPAAPCCTAGSSVLKEFFSRCQIQLEQCKQLRWWQGTRANVLGGVKCRESYRNLHHQETDLLACPHHCISQDIPPSSSKLHVFPGMPEKGKCWLNLLPFEISL